MRSRTWLWLTVALLPQVAAAQGAFELDEAFVFSGLLPVEVNRTGASVEVLEEGDIENGPIAIDDRLERLPGVTVTTSGTLGGNSVVRIRGLPQRYTGVTFDGIDISDPSAPQTDFNFGTFTSALSNRIEVAKGSQTTFYGSDAIAGSVNMTSWRPEKEGLSFETAIEAGSYETISGSLSAGYLGEAGEAALTVASIDTEGFSARAGNTEADGFDQTALSLFVSRELGEAVTLGFSGFYSNSHVEDDDGDADPTGEYYEDRKGARVFAKYRGERVDHEVSVSTYLITRLDPTGFSTMFEGGRERIAYLGTTEGSSRTKLAFGADWTEETSEIDGVFDKAGNGAVFGEVQHAISDRADLSLSLRHDFHSDFDDSTTGRVALAYRVTDDTTLKGVVGTGFRAPSLYERFGPFGSSTLEPEESTTFELGIEHRAGAATLSAVAFRNEIDNLIDFDFATFAYAQVPGQTTSQGVELAGEVDLGAMSLFGNYTYTEAENPAGRSLRVPRHDLTLGVEKSFSDKLGAAFTVRHVADRLDVDGTFATVAAPDFTVAGLSVIYKINDTTEAYIRVENLLDADYQEVLTFNSPGRSVFVGLRASF